MKTCRDDPNERERLMSSYSLMKINILRDLCLAIHSVTKKVYPNGIFWLLIIIIVLRCFLISLAEQLTQLSKNLIGKYPYLKWPTKTGEGWEPWKKSLYDKMSNYRKELR